MKSIKFDLLTAVMTICWENAAKTISKQSQVALFLFETTVEMICTHIRTHLGERVKLARVRCHPDDFLSLCPSIDSAVFAMFTFSARITNLASCSAPPKIPVYKSTLKRKKKTTKQSTHTLTHTTLLWSLQKPGSCSKKKSDFCWLFIINIL